MKYLHSIVLAISALAVACGGTAPDSTTTPEPAPEVAPAPSEAVAAEPAPAEKVKVEGIEIQSEYAIEIDFTSRKTYQWAGAEAGINDPEGRWTVPDMDIEKEIDALVDRELQAAGMTEVKSNPDVLLAYSIVVDMEAMQKMKIGNNSQSVVENVPMSAVFVAFIDPETKLTIWLGAAAAEVLENPDTETVKQRLDYAITEIVATIPKD